MLVSTPDRIMKLKPQRLQKKWIAAQEIVLETDPS